MGVRLLGLGARMAILLVFAIFFVAPILWLVLAPTKSDHALVTSSPFSFGSFHNVGAGSPTRSSTP
jgi:multiple sugar transport system permease protein